jgi:hypothetical protein
MKITRRQLRQIIQESTSQELDPATLDNLRSAFPAFEWHRGSSLSGIHNIGRMVTEDGAEIVVKVRSRSGSADSRLSGDTVGHVAVRRHNEKEIVLAEKVEGEGHEVEVVEEVLSRWVADERATLESRRRQVENIASMLGV